jgi:hypothetical protein
MERIATSSFDGHMPYWPATSNFWCACVAHGERRSHFASFFVQTITLSSPVTAFASFSASLSLPPEYRMRETVISHHGFTRTLVAEPAAFVAQLIFARSTEIIAQFKLVMNDFGHSISRRFV